MITNFNKASFYDNSQSRMTILCLSPSALSSEKAASMPSL